MENLPLAFYVPLAIHHGVADITAAYCHLTTTANDTSIRIIGQYGFRYLTIWNMILQTCYLSSAITCFVLERIRIDRCKKYAEKLQIILKFANISILSPIASFIVLLFWMVYTINREYIYPSVLDMMLPVWTNYSMHAVIIVLPLGEIFWQRNIRMPLFKHSLLALVLFLVIYSCVLFLTYFVDGAWLYPFLGEIPWPSRIFFVFVSLVAGLSLLASTTMIHKSVFSRSKIRD